MNAHFTFTPYLLIYDKEVTFSLSRRGVVFSHNHMPIQKLLGFHKIGLRHFMLNSAEKSKIETSFNYFTNNNHDLYLNKYKIHY